MSEQGPETENLQEQGELVLSRKNQKIIDSLFGIKIRKLDRGRITLDIIAERSLSVSYEQDLTPRPEDVYVGSKTCTLSRSTPNIFIGPNHQLEFKSSNRNEVKVGIFSKNPVEVIEVPLYRDLKHVLIILRLTAKKPISEDLDNKK